MEELTVREVAELYGISERRVRALAKSRGIGKKINGTGAWLFNQEEVDNMATRDKGRPKS